MSSDSSCPSEEAEEMALDLSTKSCAVVAPAGALRCIRGNLFKPRRATPYLRVPKAVRFSVDGVVSAPTREDKCCGCERENLPPRLVKETPKENDR